MKLFLFLSLVFLSACSWFGWRKHPAPDPAEIIVTGAPAGSSLFVDGLPMGDAALNDHSQVINVPPGPHTVEVHAGDKVVYREETDVALGEHRVVTVLSGAPR